MDYDRETPQEKSKIPISDLKAGAPIGAKTVQMGVVTDPDFTMWLDKISLEALVETKISRFFDQLDSHYPEDLYTLIIEKVEKTLLHQILRRTGYNQAQASKILGINRNTLRKKMKQFGLG